MPYNTTVYDPIHITISPPKNIRYIPRPTITPISIRQASAPITLHATPTKAAPSHIKAFNYGRPLTHLPRHVILVRVACGSNIQTLRQLQSEILYLTAASCL